VTESNIGFDCDRYINASAKKNRKLATAKGLNERDPRRLPSLVEKLVLKDVAVRGTRRTFPVTGGSAL
jgi:hypothetical protein